MTAPQHLIVTASPPADVADFWEHCTEEPKFVKRDKASVPFGFGRSPEWTPAGPERRTHDEATVEWARRQRDDN